VDESDFMEKGAIRRWVLVCDASRALLFAIDFKGESGGARIAARPPVDSTGEPVHARRPRDKRRRFRLIGEYSHPESRAHTHDLVSDCNGRKPGGGFGHRPGVEQDTEPKEVEAQKFARFLRSELERGLYEHAFDELRIFAPPHFLGLLRANLDGELEKRVRGTVSKDFAWLDEPELVRRLSEQLANSFAS